jgi:hypothetical protein
MSLFFEHPILDELDQRLGNAPALSRDLVSDVVEACPRFAALRHTERAARAERLIESGAWTDAVLALMALELPQWQIRRIAYDEGEWHCALSRAREVPEWLDQSIEASHTDLSIAILRGFVRARQTSASSTRSSVPPAPRAVGEYGQPEYYQRMCCDNFA